MWHKSLVCILAVGLIVSLLAFGGVACSKSPSAGQGDITVISSIDAGHTHYVTISGADIENPPDVNKTINTTFDDGHRHTITLTPQDYQTLKDSGVVTVTDSLVTGHTHTYVISK